MRSDDLPRLPGFREAAMVRRQETLGVLTAQRLTAGLTQTEVAARMGTSQSTVARLEAGEVDPRLSTLERYAHALGGRLDVELRFGPVPAVPAGPPGVTELPGPAQSPESQNPESQNPESPNPEWLNPGRSDRVPEPLRPAARLSPPPAARPAAGPSDRRW